MKYELDPDDFRIVNDVKVFRIVRLDGTSQRGGYIEATRNLSQDGLCFIHDDSLVYGSAKIEDDAQIYGVVSDNATVRGAAEVRGQVYGYATIEGKARIYGVVRDRAKIAGAVKVYGVVGGDSVFVNDETLYGIFP